MKFDVVLKGAYGSGNLGDDVLFDAVYEILLRHASANKIGIVCHPEQYVTQRATGATLINAAQNFSVDTKLLVFGGGTQFYVFKDQTTLPVQVAYALRHPIYTFQKFTGLLKREVNADHTAMVGVGMGPFEVRGDRLERVIRQVKKCDFIAVRDQQSHALCQQHDIPAQLAADIAFSSGFRQRLEASTQSLNPQPNSKIGFIVRDWLLGGESENYFRRLGNVAAKLKARGKEMDFIIFSKDAALDRKRLQKWGTLIQWDPNSMVDSDFLAPLKSYDAIVTARFHGAVFGYLLDCPIIGIKVDPKISLFLEDVKKPQYVWSAPFDEEDLLAKIDSLLSEDHNDNDGKAQLTQTADRMLRNFEEYVSSVLT